MHQAIVMVDDEGDVTQWGCSDEELSGQFEKAMVEDSTLEWWLVRGYRVVMVSSVGAMMSYVMNKVAE